MAEQRGAGDVPPPIDISICVATHNRADKLGPLIERTAGLTGARIELVIVDDGSNDGTRAVLEAAAVASAVPLTWDSIPHSGRGAALNRCFDLARGAFILLLDDDDLIEPGALADILATWDSIPEAERDGFCGVCGLAARMDGTVIGDRFPVSPMDSDFFTARIVNRIRGDKREVFRRAALGDWRFPVIPGELRVATNLLWFELASRCRTRFVNRVWLNKNYLPGGITANGLRNKMRSARLTAHYNATALRLFPSMPWWAKLRFRLDYARYAAHASLPEGERLTVLGRGPIGRLSMLIGAASARRDLRRLERQPSSSKRLIG